jgi:AhpD family alkylhydroperoxidase
MAASNTDEVLNDVKQTLGIVPHWVEHIPPSALDGFWSLMKGFYLAETAIPNKYKELIGLAVAGATRCKYCALFHTEGARLAGATDEEVAEASMMGGMSMLSSTFLNAQQTDFERFADETRQMGEYLRQQQAQLQAAE